MADVGGAMDEEGGLSWKRSAGEQTARDRKRRRGQRQVGSQAEAERQGRGTADS